MPDKENQLLTYEKLKSAVSSSAAAFRCRAILQPAGGEGDKVFPPTYLGAVYAEEERRVKSSDGQWQTIPCVLLDSVQSQANRLEEALQMALDGGRFGDSPIPIIEVDFSGEDLLNEIGKITSLQAPHRVADAILRDSHLNGEPFRNSETGAKLDHVSPNNATPLYELCPTALIFGMWDSTGPKGGLGAKFQRAMVSEIVGINAKLGKKTSSRIDPLGIRATAMVIPQKRGSYTLAKDEKAKGAVSPSKINHGNIPPDISVGGVTIDSAEQTTVLSLPALRRLHFPINNQKPDPEVDIAGRTVLAALGLAAVALAAENGYDLRSRCLLWPEADPQWELLVKPGKTDLIAINADSALATLKEAVTKAETLELKWHKEPLSLRPSPQLVALLRRSQEIAAAEAPAEGE